MLGGMPVTPMFGRLKQEVQEFESSLGYLRPCYRYARILFIARVILFDNVFKSFPDTEDSFRCFETEFHSVALVSLVFTVQPKVASNSWQLSCLIFMSTEMIGVNHHIWLPDVEL